MLGRREFLAGALGAGTLGVLAIQPRLLGGQDHVDPRSHGALGNGGADDTDAVRKALAHASQHGLPLDGGDSVFAVHGDIAITNQTRPWIKSLRLKQQSPHLSGKTLHFKNCESIQIDRLEIDRGGNKAIGDMNSAGGLWIDGGSNHRVRNVEVFGDGRANGIVIWTTRESSYDNLRVRDMEFDDASATDDVMQGIWLYGNMDCIVRNPQVSNLVGNARFAGVRYPNLRSRGIALAGNLRVSIVDPIVRNVDQGIDLTGSDGNRQCTVLRGHSYQCASVGVKLANSAVECKVVGHIAERVGMYGFLASGPSEAGLAYKTRDCAFIDCVALDVGYNRISHPTPAGFEVLRGDYDAGYPKGIRFIRCRAIDRQAVKTMKYGFYSNVAYDGRAEPLNQLIDCSSAGHIAAAQFGRWR